MSKKMGRPRKEIDWVQFEKLCAIQCTLVEISEWFGVSEDTIERRVLEEFGTTFAEHFKKKSSAGKVSLRRKQFEVAMSGNVSMLIWLGKQQLGQRDRNEIETSGSTKVEHSGDAQVISKLLELASNVSGKPQSSGESA